MGTYFLNTNVKNIKAPPDTLLNFLLKRNELFLVGEVYLYLILYVYIKEKEFVDIPPEFYFIILSFI